jgi:hypothetical protein
MQTTTINNTEEIIDSRDVIARIEYLADLFEAGDADSDEIEELAALRNLADEAEGYAPDWQYGEALIRDTYFAEYARDLADDCGMVTGSEDWPLRHIDWEAAAEELQQDYTQVDFAGAVYWIR